MRTQSKRPTTLLRYRPFRPSFAPNQLRWSPCLIVVIGTFPSALKRFQENALSGLEFLGKLSVHLHVMI
jgi:hypothetical protein